MSTRKRAAVCVLIIVLGALLLGVGKQPAPACGAPREVPWHAFMEP